MMSGTRLVQGLVAVVTLCLLPMPALAQSGICGNPFEKGGFGPFDYRMTTPQQRAVVERRHFTADVSSLRRGGSGRDIGADIAYTLNVYPNHHRALMAMADWSLRSKANPPRGAGYTIECWFERATLFAPTDSMVRVLYGNYLVKRGKPDAAIAEYEKALEMAGDDANVHYNLGLAFFDRKQFDKALQSAHMAYALGFPLPGLRDKLKRAGQWREPAGDQVAPRPIP